MCAYLMSCRNCTHCLHHAISVGCAEHPLSMGCGQNCLLCFKPVHVLLLYMLLCTLHHLTRVRVFEIERAITSLPAFLKFAVGSLLRLFQNILSDGSNTLAFENQRSSAPAKYFLLNRNQLCGFGGGGLPLIYDVCLAMLFYVLHI